MITTLWLRLVPPFVLILTAAVYARDSAADVANPMSIADFNTCLNQKLGGKRSDTADAVTQCMPKGCKFLLTMSTKSAQAACALGTCQLPRVIFDCPGPTIDDKDQGLRFRPSFLLCPYDSRPTNGADDAFGVNRIEIGEDKEKVNVPKATGTMFMADIVINPDAKYAVHTTKEVTSSIIENRRGSKACNACHDGPTGDRDDPQLSSPLDPYSGAGPNIKPYVIFDRPDRSRLVPDMDKKDGKGDRLKVGDVEIKNVSGLKEICDCINVDANGAAIETAAKKVDPSPRQANANFKIGTLRKLCTALLDYEKTRACGAMPGASCAAANGGGKFLDKNRAVSMLRFDVTGDAMAPASNTLTFTDRDGSLSAYNYRTRKNISGVVFDSVTASLLGGSVVNGAWSGDFTIAALARGKVNGVSTNLAFSLKNLGGLLSFELKDAVTNAVLAGGTGEAGRAAFIVRPN